MGIIFGRQSNPGGIVEIGCGSGSEGSLAPIEDGLRRGPGGRGDLFRWGASAPIGREELGEVESRLVAK